MAIAVEVPEPKRLGRVRFARIPDFSADSIVAFVRSAAALGVAMRIDGWLG